MITTSLGFKKYENSDNADLTTYHNDNMDLVNSKLTTADSALNNHLTDYTLQIPYGGVTTGSANTYILASPVITSLTVGMAISLKFNVDSTGTSTLNWDSKGAKGIKSASGADFTNLKTTGIYTFRFDGTNFILQGEGGETIVTSGYVRPSDWLPLPTVLETDQKIVGLYAVYPHDSNFISFTCSGAYTVDWGDGTAPENITSGINANHIYDYSSISSSTNTTRGYRQVIVVITPQSGQTLTSINVATKYSKDSYVLPAYSNSWLDLKMAGSSVTALTVSGTTNPRILEKFEWVGTNLITIFASMFTNCTALQVIPQLYTSSGTGSFISMFNGCSSLQSIPLINTSSGTGFNTFFNGCNSLQTIPLLNTSLGINFNAMFSGCSSLREIPLLNMSSSGNLSGMFTGCTSLQTMPLLNTSSATNLNTLFINCTALQSIPSLNTSSATSLSSMFSGCSSLSKAKLLGTKDTISYASCRLSATELEAIFNGLADLTSLTNKTITVTGNWGSALLTAAQKLIATNKNWTIVG